MKVQILQSGKYAEDGINNIFYSKDEIIDVNEGFAKLIVRGKLAVFIQDNIENTIVIETPKQPILETKPLDLSKLEYKDLLQQAKDKGFVGEGKGRPSTENLINFLNEVEND